MAAELLAPVAAASGDRPRVSIVMPTFRRAGVIGETLRSLIAQRFGDFELLVRDDDGSDGTEAVVRELGDPRIRYLRNPQRLRMPGNLNSGIRETVGEYVMVCHDHDLYEPDLIERMVKTLDENPGALFVHCGLLGVDDHGQPNQRWVGDYRPVTPGREWLDYMLTRMDCPVCADSMVRRSAHERFGLYDPDYGFVSDVEMWMRLCTRGDVAYLAEPLIRLREREAGHEYGGVSWELLDTILRIHRRYHREQYRGWRRRWLDVRLTAIQERLFLRRYAGCIARGDAAARAEGRRFLLSSGALLSRLAARAF